MNNKQNEKATIEAQLKTLMESQLDSIKKGIDNTRICNSDSLFVETTLLNMDVLCGDAKNEIKNYNLPNQ